MLSIHCKIALFFSFFALRGVSGCVHLEPRKTNVRRTGDRGKSLICISLLLSLYQKMVYTRFCLFSCSKVTSCF